MILIAFLKSEKHFPSFEGIIPLKFSLLIQSKLAEWAIVLFGKLAIRV